MSVLLIPGILDPYNRFQYVRSSLIGSGDLVLGYEKGVCKGVTGGDCDTFLDLDEGITVEFGVLSSRFNTFYTLIVFIILI